MSQHDAALLEATAEAIVFAHDSAIEAPAAHQHRGASSLERTAALAAAAMASGFTAPAALQQRLAAAGLTFCAQQHPDQRPTQRPAAADGRRLRPWLMGFAIGAAAAATLLWFGLLQPQRATLREQAVSLRELRAEVLAHETNAIHRSWQAGPSPLHGAVAGDVVWSQTRQDGWLTFRGLPKLDAEHAYQLWIVDGQREGAPVDGGLFTIDDPAVESLVPIRATLPIGRPAAFVVTVEAKVGAVVSNREHIVAIASL
jgi:hypothetical protein